MNALIAGGQEITRVLTEAGFEAYWVGGCVRDRLLNQKLKDIDIATNATPDQVQELFGKVKLVGASFGVCLVPMGEYSYEVTTFRRDGRYIDHRHPESVEFGTREEDALRRDFTINALYMIPSTREILDEVNGREDLTHRMIRCVGDPWKRFEEDALRMLRAIRFASRFGFRIEGDTWEAIQDLAPTIEKISPERQRDELTAILMGPAPAHAFRMLDHSGLLELLLPEISALKGVEQGAKFHPEGDVFVHTLLCLKNLEHKTLVSCWGALLHDIGKPKTFSRESGRITFYQHEYVGAEMAEEICGRLRFSNDDTRRISDVVRRHMRFITACEWRPATMRKFLAADTIEDDLAVHYTDTMSSHGDLTSWNLVTQARQSFAEREEPPIPPPLITGDDLVALGLKPGPMFREILDAVQEEQLNGTLDSHEKAMEFVQITFLQRADG